MLTDAEIALSLAYFINHGPDEHTGTPAAFLEKIGGKPEFAKTLALIGELRPDPEKCKLEVMTAEIMGWDTVRTFTAFREAEAAGWLTARGGEAVNLPNLIELGRLCLQLGRVNRATYHEDGKRPETDTDHTVMLGIVACAFADEYAPHLCRGLIAQFALVHDLVEVHAGDTNTLLIKDLADKEAREAAALRKLKVDFAELPWLHETIAAYESQATPEARFVKVLDKVMPCITHLLNGGASLRELGIVDLRSIHAAQRETIETSYGSDQPEAMRLLGAIHALLDENGPNI